MQKLGEKNVTGNQRRVNLLFNPTFINAFRYQSNSISSAPSSTYKHYGTSLGRFQNIPIALGDVYEPANKVEDLKNANWNTLADFPFSSQNKTEYYSMVTFDGELYVFGKLTIIFQFIPQSS